MRLRPGRGASAAVLACAVAAAAACSEPRAVDRPAPGSPARIVSLAPSVTDTVVALGLADRLVGVTRYCDPPLEAAPVRVGGYLDPDVEGIVALEPDLVIVIQDHEALRRQLVGLGLEVLRVDQASLDGVLDAITLVGTACGVGEKALELRGVLEHRLEAVRGRVAGRPAPRTLVVVQRDHGTGNVRAVWAAGRATFYDDVVHAAGGLNAVADAPADYPQLSVEGIIALRPEVILDVAADEVAARIDEAAMVADWDDVPGLRARVVPLTGDRSVVPGPGIVEFVERVARALHPDAFHGRETLP